MALGKLIFQIMALLMCGFSPAVSFANPSATSDGSPAAMMQACEGANAHQIYTEELARSLQTKIETSIQGCEAQDMLESLQREGHQDGRLEWRSLPPKAVGEFAVVNIVRFECGASQCRLEMETEVYRNGARFTAFSRETAALSRLVVRTFPDGRFRCAYPSPHADVMLTTDTNGASLRKYFTGEPARALRQIVHRVGNLKYPPPAPGSSSPTRELVWMEYGYIGRISIRIRNHLECAHQDSCLLSTHYLPYIPYNEVERCQLQDPFLS